MGKNSYIKKIICPLFFLGIMQLFVISCHEKPKMIEPEDVKISITPSELTLVEGEKTEISALVSGIKNYSLRWESSSPNIVSIPENRENKALLLAHSVGEATVTVHIYRNMALSDKNVAIKDFSATCTVKVVEREHINSELPLLDYDATSTSEEVVAHEKALGREPAEIHLPFEDVAAPPYYGYYNSQLTVPFVIYDLMSLVYNARMIYAFCKEEYSDAKRLYSMLMDAGFSFYTKADGSIFYSKPGETVKISPITINEDDYKDIKTMVEFIHKDVSFLQSKKLHPVLPEVKDLPTLSILDKSKEEIMGYEKTLNLRQYIEDPKVEDPNLLFVAIDPQKTNIQNVIYYKSFGYSHDKFIEANLICVESMEDVESAEFIQWMNNCGYPITEWSALVILGEKVRYTTFGGPEEDKYVISITQKTRTEGASFFNMQIRENTQP